MMQFLPQSWKYKNGYANYWELKSKSMQIKKDKN